MPFPTTPANGQTYVMGTKKWVYRSTSNRWEWVSDLASAVMTWRTLTGSGTVIGTDGNNGIIVNSSTACTLTIPNSLGTTFKTGMSVLVICRGTGVVTIAFENGITVNKKANLSFAMNGVNSQVSITKSSENVFELIGDLS
jgi:hypothetical protein